MSEEITAKIDFDSPEFKNFYNAYQEYINEYFTSITSEIISGLYSDGIINEINANTLKKFFSNPDEHQKEIENLAQYYYISSAEIHMMFELIEALPTLNYKIGSFEKNKLIEKNTTLINKNMRRIKHKRLTRDVMKQVTATGTLVGIWIGEKDNVYPYIFDDLKCAFPYYRKNGEWQCVVDLSWFASLNEEKRNIEFSNLEPYITEKDFKLYQSNTMRYRYKELPQDRTFVIRTGALKRNQPFGTSWVTSGLYDVLHKKKLKDVESSIANKIINAIAVLTIGTDKLNGEYTNAKLPKKVRQKIHAATKSALEKNQQKGITLISLPDYAKLDFPEIKTDGLNGKAFEPINSDIRSAYGLSGAVLNGESGNYATAKINIDIFYKRLAVLLEDIENEMYQKFIDLIVPKNQKGNFYLVYDKEQPLTLKEKIDILTKLNDKGWSTKHIVDLISDVSWDDYLDQTLYETQELELQKILVPYATSHTRSSKENVGRPSVDDSTNENTIRKQGSNPNSN